MLSQWNAEWMLLLPFAIQQALNHLDIEQGWMQAQHVNMESAGGAAALEFVRDGGSGQLKTMVYYCQKYSLGIK